MSGILKDAATQAISVLQWLFCLLLAMIRVTDSIFMNYTRRNVSSLVSIIIHYCYTTSQIDDVSDN